MSSFACDWSTLWFSSLKRILSEEACHHICYFGFVNENNDIFFQITIFGNVRTETTISHDSKVIFCLEF